jgi:glycosyltransferase involved in cell wall biosynthesis
MGVPWRFHTFTGQVWVNTTGVGRLLMKTIDRLIVVCADRVFADSVSQCKFLENEGVVKPGGVVVLGHGSVAGVDLARFHPDAGARAALRTELGVSNKNQIFLFVGRLVRDKGVFDLVDAFALVNAEHPQWELWMVGPDEDSIQADLEVRGVHSGARIRWFDPTPCPERFMAAADVLVLPSYREGFGSVIIEAAACGVPSIAYRIDGVIDAIIENRTGLFVDKGDIRSLSNSMKRIGHNHELRTALAESARLRAINDFSSSAVTDAWQKFYSSVLK